MSKSSSLSRSFDIAATAIDDPPCNSTSDGLESIDESSDSWEPYKALMHVDKLHDYLRANAMKTLIPRKLILKIFLDFSQPYLGWFSPYVFSE